MYLAGYFYIRYNGFGRYINNIFFDKIMALEVFCGHRILDKGMIEL